MTVEDKKVKATFRTILNGSCFSLVLIGEALKWLLFCKGLNGFKVLLLLNKPLLSLLLLQLLFI